MSDTDATAQTTAGFSEQRSQTGAEWFEYVTTKPVYGDTPFFELGVRDFAFGEIWSRPGLDPTTRRWISIACAAASGVALPVQSHIYSAMKSGHITRAELHEFVLQFGIYAGFPRASVLDGMITQAWERIEAEGGPVAQPQPKAAA